VPPSLDNRCYSSLLRAFCQSEGLTGFLLSFAGLYVFGGHNKLIIINLRGVGRCYNLSRSKLSKPRGVNTM